MSGPNWNSRSIGLVLVACIALLQVWFWQQLFRTSSYLALSDLYEYFLPNFLAPYVRWSSAEFGGFPIVADPQVAAWYPVKLLFGSVLGSWSGYVVAAYVVGATGAFAYGWRVTGSVLGAAVMGVAWPWCDAMSLRFPHLQMLHGFAWLPWALFAVERLIAEASPRNVVLAAGVFTCIGLSGHLQVVVYEAYLVGLYAVAVWAAESRTRKSAGPVVLAVTISLALCAVQFLPSLASADWFARGQVGFSQFAGSFAKQPHELIATLVPQFCYERREGPLYVGITTIVLAAVGVVGGARRWRTWFWVSVAIIGLLLGLGPATPFAETAYTLPLYDRFRIVARHLAFSSWALVALGGFGAAYLATGRASRRAIAGATAVMAAISAGALMLVRSRPDLFSADCASRSLHWIYAGMLSDVGAQGVIAATALGLVVLTMISRLRVAAVTLLLVVLGVDLLNVQITDVGLAGLQQVQAMLLPPALATPSVHAEALKQWTAPQHQRVLPLEGSALDPVVPGTWARVWGLDSLGAYNPLLPAGLNRLTEMGTNGSVPDTLLLDVNQALDLFAVREVIVRANRLSPGAPVQRIDQVADLDVEMGPADCRPKGAQHVELRLPGSVAASAVELELEVVCSDNLKDGVAVGTVSVGLTDGTRLDVPLTQPLPTRLRIPLARPGEVDRLRITTVPMPAWVRVHRVAVVAGDGLLHPATLPLAIVAGSDRWREVQRFRTSRQSDRGHDEDAAGEDEFVVFENRRARPRVWLVHETREVSDEWAPDALRSGQTRDGTRFDVSTTALVPPGTEVPRTLGHGTGHVEPVRVAGGDIVARVDSGDGGLLVISELHHPGWVATIDGQPAPVLRVDYAMMGVRVGPGRHEVVLAFRPPSMRLGEVVSGIALVLCVGLLLMPSRKRDRDRNVD